MTNSAKSALRTLAAIFLIFGLTDLLRAVWGYQPGVNISKYDVASIMLVGGLLLLNWKKEAGTATLFLLAGRNLLFGTLWPKLNWTLLFLSAAVLLLLFVFDRYDTWNNRQKILRQNSPPGAESPILAIKRLEDANFDPHTFDG